MLFGDYRIYTHRPGGIKIRRLSDNKQLVVISDKFKVKYYNGGEKIYNVEIDLERLNIGLYYQDVQILKWTGKYVKKHQANFILRQRPVISIFTERILPFWDSLKQL